MKTTVQLKKLTQSYNTPVQSKLIDDDTLFVSFKKAVFGTLIIKTNSLKGMDRVTVHFAEKLDLNGRIDRNPPGTIRYRCVEHIIDHSKAECRIIIPPDKRNTDTKAIKMPTEIGEVIPFRYVEIEKGQNITKRALQQAFVHYPFNDDASDFECSNDVLNQVWELCKYSIKATTFCGVYVDGDRERIPYEGDAYINQLGHYCVDQEYDFARYSHEYMMQYPTWCTEWHLHSVMMAWTDYMYSGEKASLEKFYDDLCAKTLEVLAREDGLISTDKAWKEKQSDLLKPFIQKKLILEDIRDVMDWPPGSFTKSGGIGERDDHEMLAINTVTNAFHCHALKLMSNIAKTIGKHEDAKKYLDKYTRCLESIQLTCFNQETHLYIDGEGSNHSSLHSNMFMLAFDLVPDDKKSKVIDFIKSKGMVCSVYGAQHLLDGLYLNNEGQFALNLMSTKSDRGWWNMIAAGSTMTLEAWDIKYKNNLDWNHAWGAAPANIIPRYILGIRPIEAGFKKVIIEPQIGDLDFVKGTTPTPHGPVEIVIYKQSDSSYKMNLTIPNNTVATVMLPYTPTLNPSVRVNHVEVQSKHEKNKIVLDDFKPGSYLIET